MPSYPRLLASLGRLLIREPALRHSCALHGLLFGAYTATWTSLVLVLTRAPYHHSSAVAGLFGALGFHDPVGMPPIVGRAAIRDFIAGVIPNFGPFLGLTPHEAHTVGSSVAVSWSGAAVSVRPS